jgi:hypothetical protein
MRRRLFIASAVSFVLPLPAIALTDEEARRKLIGVWIWNGVAQGERTDHEMVLGGDNQFSYSQSDQSGHLVMQRGIWGYQGGWIGFSVHWSNSIDATGQYIQLGPIQVLDIGDDYVRTPQGIANRKN